jgi:hypothetical protein
MSAGGGDVMAVVGGAEKFFKLVFSSWSRWDKDGRPYQRGAWVRLYGVPLSAWNVDFFKLCVLDCGTFVRADSCSEGKDRLDFAQVLIATSDLEIVARIERVLVDGVQVDIKVVEEWGYAIWGRIHVCSRRRPGWSRPKLTTIWVMMNQRFGKMWTCWLRKW